MKRLFAVLLACCFLILPSPVLAAAPAPGLTVPLTPDPRTGHYKITVSDTEAITGSSVTRSVERTGITAKTDVLVEYPLDVEHPGTYYVTVTALPEAGRIGLEAPFSKTVPVVTGCCPGVEGAFILGCGSAADPYQVYAPAQLKHVNAHLDAHFIQERDLTLSGTWTPLGALTGVYDGGGYSISGLDTTVGLFSVISGQSAVVRNLRLINPKSQGGMVSGMMGAGTIAGFVGSGKILDCSATGVSVYGSDADILSTGGLVGLTDSARIERCTVTGTVGGEARIQLHHGGIVGHSSNSVYIGCLSSVQFSGSAGYSVYMGGISGATQNNSSPITLQNCHWTNPAWALGNGSGTGSTPNAGDSFGNSQVASIDG